MNFSVVEQVVVKTFRLPGDVVPALLCQPEPGCVASEPSIYSTSFGKDLMLRIKKHTPLFNKFPGGGITDSRKLAEVYC